MSGNDHSHVHGPDCNHDHEHAEEPSQASRDAAAWLQAAKSKTCPECDATGAMMLGGGIFCPTCGKVSTNPGYQAPAGS
ncbi:MAG: hypothetical protein WCH31_04120 [Actinomycetes bacterium]